MNRNVCDCKDNCLLISKSSVKDQLKPQTSNIAKLRKYVEELTQALGGENLEPNKIGKQFLETLRAISDDIQNEHEAFMTKLDEGRVTDVVDIAHDVRLISSLPTKTRKRVKNVVGYMSFMTSSDSEDEGSSQMSTLEDIKNTERRKLDKTQRDLRKVADEMKSAREKHKETRNQ